MPIVPRQYSNRMPAFRARTGRRGFHNTGATSIYQHGAAPRDLAPNLERKLANSARRITRTDNRHNLMPLHFFRKTAFAKLCVIWRALLPLSRQRERIEGEGPYPARIFRARFKILLLL